METAGALAGRAALGVVVNVTNDLASVRLFLPDGGAVEAMLPAIGVNLLTSGAAVVALFLGDDPTSGVVVGALEGAQLAALATHSHDAYVPWVHFDQGVKDFVGDYLVDSLTVVWEATAGGLEATVMGVRSVTTAQRNALAAVDGMLVYNSTSGKFEGRAAGVWVALH